MSPKKTGGMLLIILLVYGVFIEGSNEVPMAINTHDQYDPAISEDEIIVWTDDRNKNEDIYMYYPFDQAGYQITYDENDQMDPAVYGDMEEYIIVWTDMRNDEGDIYGYYHCTKEPAKHILPIGEFRITQDPGEQRNPAIYGYIVVWQDNRKGNWDIYGYNLKTGEEFEVVTDQQHQYNPAIFGNKIIWEDMRKGNKDIYGCYYDTKVDFIVTEDPNTQQNPAIFGNIVVWQDDRNGDWDIYGYSLSTKGDEFPIVKTGGNQENPAIHNDTAVWQDFRDGNWNIYGYKISTEEEFQIITDSHNQTEPALYGNFVVWTDNRNGDLDVYRYDLLEKFPVIIWIERGYGGEYFMDEMLTVYWAASQRFSLSLKDSEGNTIDQWGSYSGKTSTGRKLKEEYGYEKKIVCAETLTYSVECEFYIVKKVASVEVTVTDQDGNPLPGAEVRLDGEYQELTDNSGKCTIKDVEFGEYTIIAKFDDTESEKKEININSTMVLPVDLEIHVTAATPPPTTTFPPDTGPSFDFLTMAVILLIAAAVIIVFIVMRRPKKPEEKKEPEKKIPEKKTPEEKPQKDIPPKIPEKELPPRQPIPPEKPNYEEFKRMWDNVKGSEDTKEKGKLLEDFFEKLLEDSNRFNVVGRDIRSEFEEIDLVSSHDLEGIFKKVDPIILIECKNWSKKAGKNELVSFYDKILNRRPHSNLGIFVSVKGFKRTVNDFLKSKAESDIKVVLISGDDIDNMFAMNQDIVTLIEEKFKRNIILMRE